MKIYQVFSGVASSTAQTFTLPDPYYKAPPYAIDIFNFGSARIKIAFVNKDNEQQDWIIIPGNFFYYIDPSKLMYDLITQIKVVIEDTTQTSPFQIIVWYRR